MELLQAVGLDHLVLVPHPTWKVLKALALCTFCRGVVSLSRGCHHKMSQAGWPRMRSSPSRVPGG